MHQVAWKHSDFQYGMLTFGGDINLVFVLLMDLKNSHCPCQKDI